MNGHDDNPTVSYSRANDNAARLIVYLGPYLLWGTVGAIVTGILLFG